MRAFQHANDPAFGAVPVGESGAPLHFCHHAIAMHGVFNGQSRNKHVAVKFGNGFIRDDKAVAIVMQHKAAADFVPTEGFSRDCSAFGAGVGDGSPGIRLSRTFPMPFSRRVVVGLPVAQSVPPAGNFVDGAPLF
jgi:hypothetical protein